MTSFTPPAMTNRARSSSHPAVSATASSASDATEAVTFWVEPWNDPVLDQLGYDARSSYVDTFWLSILGPSTTWLLRRLVSGLEREPDGFQLDCATTSTALGLGGQTGKNSTLMRAVDRACRFGMAQRHADHIYVRRHMPPLSARQVSRLPEQIRAAHATWNAQESKPQERRA